MNTVVISNMRYTDDVLVVEQTEEKIKWLMSTLTKERQNGFDMNGNNIKVFVFSRNLQGVMDFS